MRLTWEYRSESVIARMRRLCSAIVLCGVWFKTFATILQTFGLCDVVSIYIICVVESNTIIFIYLNDLYLENLNASLERSILTIKVYE